MPDDHPQARNGLVDRGDPDVPARSRERQLDHVGVHRPGQAQEHGADRIPALLLDFTQVGYIDSSGLATLVEYYQISRSYAGRIALTGLSKRVKSVFDLVRLSEIFSIYPSVEEAKQGLQSKP